MQPVFWLSFCFLMRLKVPLDCVEGFVAQVVLDFACVVQGGFLRDAQAHKQLAEDGVALVDVGRDGAAFLGQVWLSSSTVTSPLSRIWRRTMETVGRE